MQTTFPITALRAQAAANLFLSEHLPDRFTADQAQFNPQGGCWHVPVILAYPGVGALGGAGKSGSPPRKLPSYAIRQLRK